MRRLDPRAAEVPTDATNQAALAVISDDELARRIASGDADALAALYDRYNAAVHALCRRIVRDDAAAEDLVQEAFFRVWGQAKGFEPGKARLATWLLSIAHHVSIDFLRRKSRRPVTVADEAATTMIALAPDPEPSAPDLVWMAEKRRLIRAAMALLPDAQRQAVEMAYFGGMTQMEIAAAQGAPVSTVKTRLALGLRKLADALAAQGFTAADAAS